MESMNELQSEIDGQLTAFFRNLERFTIASGRNPLYRSEAEQALKISAQLAQIEQAAQRRRIADAMEGKA